MKPFNKEEYNRMCAEFMGWEYFPESKSGNTWPDGCHDGSYTTFDIWVKNPTEKYREILCHSDYEYLDGKYNSDIEQEDLFDDYKYKLEYDTDWNDIMEVITKIKDKDTTIALPMNNIQDSVVPYINAIRPITHALINVNKEEVVQSIWQFLNWYNENK